MSNLDNDKNKLDAILPRLWANRDLVGNDTKA